MTLTALASLAEDLAAGRTTSRALLDHCLDRAQDPAGEGALAFLQIDAAQARHQADLIDRERAAGHEARPFAGIPVSVKDLFDVAGQVTRAGSELLSGTRPAQRDAESVARLRAAGFVIVGRTNMTEFAYSGLGLNPHHGTPANAWDRAARRIPGGSSSGAAISVTDGMAAAGLGTDTGGSCRIPAALNGIAGFKPTAASVPQAGCFPLSESLDSIGSLAPSVACCAALHGVLSGSQLRLPAGARSVRGLRLGLPQTVVLDGLDADVQQAFERALGRLSAAGAAIVELPLTEFAEVAQINQHGGLIAAEAYALHQPLLQQGGARYDPRVKVRIEKGAAQSAALYLQTRARRRDWIARVRARIAGIDFLVFPTVPTIAPTIASLADEDLYGRVNLAMLRNPSFGNFLDGCSVSLPCQQAGDAPVGLMLTGRNGQDESLLLAAQAVEALLA